MLISGPDAALMHTLVQGMGHLLGLRFASSTFNAYGDVADWMSNGIVGSVVASWYHVPFSSPGWKAPSRTLGCCMSL